MDKTGKVKKPRRPLGGSRDCRSSQGGRLLFTALTRVHINPRHTWIDSVKCIPTAAQDEIFTCRRHRSRAPAEPLLDGAAAVITLSSLSSLCHTTKLSTNVQSGSGWTLASHSQTRTHCAYWAPEPQWSRSRLACDSSTSLKNTHASDNVC